MNELLSELRFDDNNNNNQPKVAHLDISHTFVLISEPWGIKYQVRLKNKTKYPIITRDEKNYKQKDIMVINWWNELIWISACEI